MDGASGSPRGPALRILYVVRDHPRVPGRTLYRDAAGRVTSDLASTRYRVLLPAVPLAAWGHRIAVVPASSVATGKEGQPVPDIVVFSKSDGAGNEAFAAAMKRRGARIVLDVCDHPWDGPARDADPGHLVRMAAVADAIVTPSPTLSAILRERLDRSPFEVADPVEGPAGRVRAVPSASPLRLATFGYMSRLGALADILPGLLRMSGEVPWTMELVTRPLPMLRRTVDAFNARHGADRLVLTPWSVHATWRALARCDFVVLTSPATGWAHTHSANRLLEAIRAGRLAIASPTPAYRRHAAHAWIGDDLAAGLRWALAHPGEAAARVEDGQKAIEAEAVPAAIARNWERVFRSVATRAPTVPAAPAG